MNTLIISIDPGKNGAIVLRNGDKVVCVDNMPDTCIDLTDIIEGYKLYATDLKTLLVAYLEVVHAMPNQGTVSMFTFGQGFGHLEQVLADFRIRTVKVRPAQWKVYRSLCFGLMKIHLHISPQSAWELSAEVVVEYVCKSKATSFRTEQEAESLIKEIENNPDKFVIYK